MAKNNMTCIKQGIFNWFESADPRSEEGVIDPNDDLVALVTTPHISDHL